jgi:hypothetical protein
MSRMIDDRLDRAQALYEDAVFNGVAEAVADAHPTSRCLLSRFPSTSSANSPLPRNINEGDTAARSTTSSYALDQSRSPISWCGSTTNPLAPLTRPGGGVRSGKSNRFRTPQYSTP